MRTLSKPFISKLKTGIYKKVLELVINDNSLDLEIRDGKINIYFKGNSILKLTESGITDIHKKFLTGTGITKLNFTNSHDVDKYLDNIPKIKDNVIKVKSKRPTLEIEYEQLLIRSNNLNRNVNSDIILTDRQNADSASKSRFDLTGFYWERSGRRQGQTVPLAFIEVKYSLNNDIQDIDQQISKYYKYVKNNIKYIAQETEELKNQKIDLGLIIQSPDRLKALKTLNISSDIDEAIFIIALIDYNPHSKLLNSLNLKSLHFNNRIRIFTCGFAVWDNYLKKV